MSFGFRHEIALWALAGVMAIGLSWWWQKRRRRLVMERFGQPSVLRSLVAGSAHQRRTQAVLFFVGLSFAVLAWAGPQYGSRLEIQHKRGIDLVFALDFSKSMLARDVHPNRIERTKAEITQLISELDGDRIGIVAFAGDTIEFPMTVDPSALALFLRDLSPYDMPVGGTAIGRALIASQNLLARSSSTPLTEKNRTRTRLVVLLTDGEDHEGEPLEAAKELNQHGIRVFTVGVGSKSGEPIPTMTRDGIWTGYMRDADNKPILTAFTTEAQKMLQEIANTTGGKYFRAQRGSIGVEAIRAEIRQMKHTELAARKITVLEDRYLWALVPAFVLLFLASLSWPLKKSATSVVATVLLCGLLVWPSASQAWDLFRSPNDDIEDGNELLAKKDYKGALENYNRAVKKLPADAGVHLNRGLALFHLGKLDDAKQALTTAAESGASSILQRDARYNLAQTFYKQGEEASKKNQTAPASAHFQEAADAAKKALKLKPGDLEAARLLELAKQRIQEEKQKEEKSKEKSSEDKKDEDKPEDKPQDKSKDDSQKENKPQEKPEDKKQESPDKDPKSKEPEKSQEPQPAAKPKAEPQPTSLQKAQQTLDALQEQEESLDKHLAKMRARQEPRRVAKDW